MESGLGSDLKAAIDLLKTNGYLVAKIPECKFKGRGHGRHTLITRSGMCEGEEPIPHGYQSGHMGSFGWWIHCQCGHAFADYAMDSGSTPWNDHVKFFNIKVT